MQELQIELEGLCVLRKILEILHHTLRSELVFYTDKVMACRDSGLTKEITQGFFTHLEQDRGIMSKLLHNIEDVDIPYVDMQIRQVEEEMGAAY